MLKTSNLLYSADQIRDLEKIAIQDCQLSADILMQRAGEAAFRELQAHWPKAKYITVVCGKGNNGGDGYVIARCAHEAKLKVQILNLVSIDKLSGAAKNAADECIKAKIKIEAFSAEKLQHADVIVDALLGTGIIGDVHLKFQETIKAVNASNIPILAVDLPSGLEANTGNILGVAIKAELTVTFIANKTGLFIGEGPECTGKVLCDDLDIPEEIFRQINPSAQLQNFEELKHKLVARKHTANKGNFGHVLVVGGDYGMGGAVRMAAEAAARVGAGLVSVATRPQHVSAINAARPEIMCHGISFWWQLRKLLERATVVVIGPGLGQSYWSKRLLTEVLYANKTLVVDADALNLLADTNLRYNDWVLTPHPGEAARLLQITVSKVQEDRIAAVKALQIQTGGVCVLKGSGTLIAGTKEVLDVCSAGNPGMASGGMGDILSGIIGGLVAQGLSLTNAAKLGVQLHARAGDLAAECNGERGLLALDLLPFVQRLANATT